MQWFQQRLRNKRNKKNVIPNAAKILLKSGTVPASGGMFRD